MAWGWAAAGQLGLGQCHQGSHTVLHPTPVSVSLYSSSSSPLLQCISCVLFQELGLHVRPLSQLVDLLEMRKTDSFKVLPLMLVTDHMSHYPKAKLCDFVPLT